MSQNQFLGFSLPSRKFIAILPPFGVAFTTAVRCRFTPGLLKALPSRKKTEETHMEEKSKQIKEFSELCFISALFIKFQCINFPSRKRNFAAWRYVACGSLPDYQMERKPSHNPLQMIAIGDGTLSSFWPSNINSDDLKMKTCSDFHKMRLVSFWHQTQKKEKTKNSDSSELVVIFL